MPSLKAIRKRITSVKNTQKITRAMKLVAAARLRRAQDQIVAARPYAKALTNVIAEIAARAGEAHPLLETRPIRRVQLVLVTSDRGLAGAFNSNVNRAAERFQFERGPEFENIALTIVGRKGREYFRRRKATILREVAGTNTAVAEERSRELAATLIEDYLEKRVDAVYLVYNEFKSAISQKVEMEQVLPVVPRKLPADATPTDFLYEPSRAAVLDRLVPMYVQIELYRVFLESIASEFGARMSAMDNATNNARDMMGRLTLQYNRARQAAITKELLEIISGAESLKG